MQLNEAKHDALVKLARLRNGVKESQMEIKGARFSSTKTEGFLSGTQTLEKWMSPEGELFVIMSVERKN